MPLINKQWKLGKQIGSGGFGTVFEATDVRTKKAVAIKMELRASKKPSLEREKNIYEAIHGDSEVIGIPQCYYYGQYGLYNVLVLDLLGKSLSQVQRKNGGEVGIKYVLKIGVEALYRLQSVHRVGFVHRDIKPHNLLTCSEGSDLIYLVYD